MIDDLKSMLFEGEISRERAILWITVVQAKQGMEPRSQQLRSLLSNPLTRDQIEALSSLMEEKCSPDEMIQWLMEGGRPWAEFLFVARTREKFTRRTKRRRSRD